MDIKVELLFRDRGNVIASDVLRGKPEREKSKCSAIRNLVSAAPQKWAGLVDAGNQLSTALMKMLSFVSQCRPIPRQMLNS